jgi:hypothetical protein
VRATGVGSLPGTDAWEAARIVAGELPDFIHLAELPQRGPGADVVGRTAALIHHVTGEFALDTTPLGWRVSGTSGRTMRRAWSWFAEDMDALESTTDGYAGDLKVQIAGPWTLAAKIEARTGQRLVADQGACRDLAQALATTTQWLIQDVQRRINRIASLSVQFDEPSLSAVAAGAIDTASGLSRYRAVEPAAMEASLRVVFDATRDAGAIPGAHACEPGTPWHTVVSSGAQFVSFDMMRGCPSDEQLGTMWESGRTLLAGTVPIVPEQPMDGRIASEPIRAVAERLGLTERFDAVVVTPTAGLGGSDPGWVNDAYGACRAAARVLRDEREQDE